MQKMQIASFASPGPSRGLMDGAFLFLRLTSGKNAILLKRICATGKCLNFKFSGHFLGSVPPRAGTFQDIPWEDMKVWIGWLAENVWQLFRSCLRPWCPDYVFTSKNDPAKGRLWTFHSLHISSVSFFRVSRVFPGLMAIETSLWHKWA